VLRDYKRILWRRKWLVLFIAALTTGVAVYLSQRQEPVYKASADVLLRHDNLAGTLTGVDDTSGARADPARVSRTQADLARVRPLAARVVRRISPLMTVDEFIDSSSVTPRTNSDILTFSVESEDSALARLLATAYAREYTLFRRELDTAAIQRARSEAQTRLEQLEAAGRTESELYLSLDEKVQLLNTLAALQTSNAYVVEPADAAPQVSPNPRRNGALALTLGLIFGVGLAFLRETLDTRVRSAEEIATRLELPLLARLSAPTRKLRKENRLVAVEDPTSANAEAFRILKTNLDFVDMDRAAQMILVTSAIEGEGKSTTASNLAVTLARSGRRVILVDLDTRRPFLHMFFGLLRDAGLTRVALGDMELRTALRPVALTHKSASDLSDPSGNGTGRVHGVLEVLPLGPIPPNPGEFAASATLASVLRSLRERADVVLIDAPPLLGIGDALVLSSQVDALLLVTRLHTLRRSMLGELHRLLEACPAKKLGFVLAGAELEEGFDSLTYGAYSYQRHEQKEPERAL
jgi:polysaccharide biosynthesis transport protein